MLVEVSKTAIYGALYFGFPEQPKNLLWLAVYNLSSLNFSKCKVLEGRAVYLFPDLSKEGRAFKLWTEKANNIQRRLEGVGGTYFKVSDLLEQMASKYDKIKGYDLADYLIKLDWRHFRNQCNENINHNNSIETPNSLKTPKTPISEKSVAA